ncbi:MAG: J domain-containing protein, partial [Vicinamibacterales bacterium]|nr:J domain-containing protein [Vicinamibacterales bacterium]
KLHPDVNPGDQAAESRFKLINEAYEVLGDPEKRRKYDELGANWRQYEQGSGTGAPGWTANTGGPGGYTTMSADDMRRIFGDQDPFSDFFHTFFGGSGPRPRPERAPKARRGRDSEHDLELTLEEAFAGTTRRLSVKHDGHARSVDVRIPAGVAEGSRVRVAGEGGHGAGGAAAGDLYLRLRLLPHARFDRKVRDLYARAAVPVTVAVLGGELSVPAIDGHALRLRVPPSTQNGQVFRLKGHGMPAVGKPDQRGDLYVTVDVRLPRQLSPEQKRLFEELARLEGGAEPPQTPS